MGRVGRQVGALALAVYLRVIMQKRLPPQTARSLNPPANVLEPYSFFESVQDHPLQPLDTALNLRNAWWLADAALLAYSAEAAVREAFAAAGIPGDVTFFQGGHSTQAYVMSMPGAIVLAFRGTQVDDFWSSVLDFAIDAQLIPVRDSHGDLVHAGFLHALGEVWPRVSTHLQREQSNRPRPLWITGHSLGAALATLAANLCADAAIFGLKGVYTFGSPRVGDAGFGAKIRGPVFRFRNDSDIVPHLPLGLVFSHAGKLQFIDGAGHLHSSVPSPVEGMLDHGAHIISARDALMMKGLIRTGGAFELPVPGLLADHAPINYSILAWNIYDASVVATG